MDRNSNVTSITENLISTERLAERWGFGSKKKFLKFRDRHGGPPCVMFSPRIQLYRLADVITYEEKHLVEHKTKGHLEV